MILTEKATTASPLKPPCPHHAGGWAASALHPRAGGQQEELAVPAAYVTAECRDDFAARSRGLRGKILKPGASLSPPWKGCWVEKVIPHPYCAAGRSSAFGKGRKGVEKSRMKSLLLSILLASGSVSRSWKVNPFQHAHPLPGEEGGDPRIPAQLGGKGPLEII